MSDPQWVQCRLRRATLDRLRDWIKVTLKAQRFTVTDEVVSRQAEGMGVDIAVAILLDRDVRHRERSRKSRK